MRQPSAFDIGAYAAAIAVGLALIVVARWASRHRGSRLDTFVALRVGDVLLAEVIGAFLIGYGIGSLVSIESDRRATPGPPSPPIGGRLGGMRGFGMGDRLPFTLAIAFALIAVLVRIDIRDLLLGGRSTPHPLRGYIGLEARVVAPIPAGGHGEITVRDPSGNITSVAAAADVAVPVGADVRVIGTRDLNLVVAPLASARHDGSQPGWRALPDRMDGRGGPLTQVEPGRVVSLGALCDLGTERSADPGSQAFSVSEFVTLEDGRRVILHEDRGFTIGSLRSTDASDPGDLRASVTLEGLTRHVLNTVLPDDDEPTEDHPWSWLAELARTRGLSVTANDLRGLLYEVTFTDRVHGWLSRG